MSLFDKIKADQLQARKDRNTITSTLLTTLIGEVSAVAKNENREVTDDDVLKTIRKFLKGNTELQAAVQKAMLAIANLEVLGADANAARLADAEAEAKILNGYLPKQLGDDELRAAIKEGYGHGFAQMGSLMSYLKEKYAGLYDGKKASQFIKEQLS